MQGAGVAPGMPPGLSVYLPWGAQGSELTRVTNGLLQVVLTCVGWGPPGELPLEW